VLQRPQVRTFLVWGLKVSIASLILGYLILSLGIENSLAGLHLVFIGGLALLTLMVATRVTVAHGGASLDLELSAQAILGTAFFFGASAAARSLAGSDYRGWLMIAAAVLFLTALGTWFGRFYRLFFR